MKIALLGAESTGKTWLSQSLARALEARGLRVAVVSEYLREWCDAAGRTPRPEEQDGIAAEQARRVDAAVAGDAGDTPGSAPDVVIADTTPLMVAIYSEMLFGDPSLQPMAQAHQRGYDVTLLTGLDIPWVADGLQRDGPHVREPVDARVRAALTQAGVNFRVVYGSGETRLRNALAAIDSAWAERPASTMAPLNGRCEKCSDPDCEHKLFSDLLARGAAPTRP